MVPTIIGACLGAAIGLSIAHSITEKRERAIHYMEGACAEAGGEVIVGKEFLYCVPKGTITFKRETR